MSFHEVLTVLRRLYWSYPPEVVERVAHDIYYRSRNTPPVYCRPQWEMFLQRISHEVFTRKAKEMRNAT